MGRLALLACALLLAAHSATAALVEHWWTITYVQANPDQLSERRVIGVNGSWPPPPVIVNQNDTLHIHVTNGLDVPTALHTHGIYFNGTGYFDGAVAVTQCGIPPNGSFTYDIPTNLQSGTYWIHGHFSGQYVDGLRTPFIIHPPKNAHAYDDEFTIVMGDWYHDQHATLLKQFLHKYNPTGAEPVPNSALLYIMHNNTYLQPYSELAKGTQVGDRAVLPFQTGKTYRLRLINMSALAAFYFSIDGHTMRVIEVDGVETQELEAGALPISTAQRYSVLVTARNDTANNWAIHANMDPDMFDAIPDDLQLNITAQVVYDEKAPLSEPVIYDQYPEFEELNLVPVEVEGMAPADVVYDLNVNFDTYNDGTNRASFNNITFQFSKVPSLFSMLSMGQDANNPVIYGAQTNALMATHNQMVQINIYNWDAGKHPFHLHGHKFAVVQKNYDATVGQPINETQVNPVRRDTIMVPPTGSISMRFRADNPGAWLIHCHIEWHLESGLAAIVFEAPNEAQQRIKVPQFMIDQCASQQIPTSGNAVGKNSTTDLKGEPWGPFPQTLGWTARAKGALAGTVLAALAGMASVVWYSSHQYSQEEVEEIHRRRQAARAERGSRFQQLRSMFQ